MKINHYISALLTAICMMMAAMTSCSDRIIEGPSLGGNAGDDATMQIGINVVLPMMSGSRAEYEQANDYENTVDLEGKDFRLMLFTKESKTLVCSFDPESVSFEFINGSFSYRVARVTANVDKTLAVYTDLRLVMLANWGDYPYLEPGVTRIDDLSGYAESNGIGTVSTSDLTTFEASSQLVAGERNYIPLFGVKECNNIVWKDGSVTWLNDLWLLRAVAKIEVLTSHFLPIESVELTRYNAKGTCAPRGVYSESQYVSRANDEPDLYKPVDYVTLPGGRNDDGLKGYKLGKVGLTVEESSFVVYVPEYQILSDYSKPTEPMADMPKLLVKFVGEDEEHELDFKYYTKDAADKNDANVGDYFDIRRNYIYRYDVRRVGGGLEWHVDVQPYTSVDLKPDFGLLLANVTLNKYVARLYTDPEGPTQSRETLVAYDENNKKLTASGVKWRLSSSIDQHVCEIERNDDGTCTVTPIEKATGRDIVEAVMLDKNGFEITAECIVEVTERHLGLDKTFLGLVPQNVLEDYSHSSFRVNVVAERTQYSKLSWKLCDEKDQPLKAGDDLYNLVAVSAEADGSPLDNGGSISEKTIDIKVQANNQGKYGTVHLWVYYSNDAAGTVEYATHCVIEVSQVNLTVFPTKLELKVGQQTSVTARTRPVFSDYIPHLMFESQDESVVTVDDNGLVTAVGPGSTTIKVSSPDDLFANVEAQEVEVVVAPDDLVLMREDFNINADYIELLSGESVQLKAYSGSTDITGQVAWSIVDESYVDISGGLVTAGTEIGTSTVKATYTVGGVTYSETCIFVVATSRKLSIEGLPNYVTANASVPLKAYVFPDKRPYDQRTYNVTWTSSDESVIAIEGSTAVAKKSGSAIITAKTIYNGVEYDNSVRVNVQGEVEKLDFHLKIYDSNGNEVREITSEYAYYPGYETGDWTGETNVGENKLFDIIYIPVGQEWEARIIFGSPDVKLESIEWKWSKRYNWYDDRIQITPAADGMTCKIKECSTVQSIYRYNEINLRFEYDGATYTRRFCVYTQYPDTQY